MSPELPNFWSGTSPPHSPTRSPSSSAENLPLPQTRLNEPEPEEREPYRDLSGQVEKTEEFYFDYGGFSEIYKGEWNDPETNEKVQVAIKLLRGVHTDPTVLTILKRRLNRETRVWHRLSHTNVLPFLGVCHRIGPSPAMISPMYENGDVEKYLRNNPTADRLAIIRGAARGLEYLHSENVVHGDLKGHNVLINSNGQGVLADFGRSKLIDHRGFTTSFAGSSRYLAPELMENEEEIGIDDYDDDPADDPMPNLTKETDVYAFSMVIIEIMTGKLPYHWLRQDTTVVAVVQEGGRPERERCLPTVFSDLLWSLLVACWDTDPVTRPEMSVVVRRLEEM